MKPILEIKNLHFRYDKQIVLEDINLQVYPNDFLALIGQNGGGKSTLLKLILGILKPQKGDIDIHKDYNQIGYVPQNTDINISFPIRVFEVVLMGSKSRFGYSDKEKQEAIESLEKVGMSEFFESKIGNLSGGQRQRVLIARALYLKPKILLLDEPTSNIDTKGQKEIYSLLKELNKEITIIVVSHDISILRYTNKVAHINRVLTMHEAPNKKLEISEGEHFCEIELLEMIGKKDCKC